MALVAYAGDDELSIREIAIRIKNNRSGVIKISKGETITIKDEVTGAQVPLASSIALSLQPGDMALLIVDQ